MRKGRTELPTPKERFWSHVDKSNECWQWTGAAQPEGYGTFKSAGVKMMAHRFAYELAYGPIPAGLQIDHMCHSPSCVRYSHLQAVTKKQNAENRSGPPSNNTSGARGVTWNAKRRKWCAAVGSGGKSYYAGRYSTLAEAEAAAIAKRNELFTNNLLDRRA